MSWFFVWLRVLSVEHFAIILLDGYMLECLAGFPTLLSIINSQWTFLVIQPQFLILLFQITIMYPEHLIKLFETIQFKMATVLLKGSLLCFCTLSSIQSSIMASTVDERQTQKTPRKRWNLEINSKLWRVTSYSTWYAVSPTKKCWPTMLVRLCHSCINYWTDMEWKTDTQK